MKICTVPIDKAQELCPDPRIFNVCSIALSCCKLKEDIRKKLEEYNYFCESNNCPYLKEKVKVCRCCGAENGLNEFFCKKCGWRFPETYG